MRDLAIAGPAKRFVAFYAAVTNELSTPHRLIAASAVRVVLGAVVTSIYLIHIRFRAFLWGPNGEIPGYALLRNLHERQDFINLYQYAQTEWQFELLFFTGLAVSILYTIGFRPRIIGIPMFVFTWSLFYRNELVMNGGYRMLIIVLAYLMFAQTGRYFSVDGASRRQTVHPVRDRLLAVLHNYAIMVCMAQIIVMYTFSTFYKIEGHMWQDGTALYYILRDSDFNIPGVSRLIYEHAMLVTLGTYGALILQAVFPWLVFHKRLKWFVLVGAMSFHLGIAVLMGLVWFSTVIIALDLFFIKDETFRAAYHTVRRLVLRQSRLLPLANAPRLAEGDPS